MIIHLLNIRRNTIDDRHWPVAMLIPIIAAKLFAFLNGDSSGVLNYHMRSYIMSVIRIKIKSYIP